MLLVGWGQNLVLMAHSKNDSVKYDDFTCPKNAGIYKMDIVYTPILDNHIKKKNILEVLMALKYIVKM